MIITKTCITCEHYPNDKHCIGCLWDKDKKENTKWELMKDPIVIERKVLDKIRDEVAQLHSDMNVINYNLAIGNVLDIIDKYR